MATPFLTARWTDLVIASYAVDRAILEPHLPPGCEPDLWRGSAYVSLVCFDFRSTRVGGFEWPGFVDFPEINLRAYVRHRKDRGVVFLRELVPQYVVAWCARFLYREPYFRASISNEIDKSDERVRISHRFRFRGADNRVVAECDPALELAAEGSPEHFFKEHDRGFGVDRRGRRIEYRVYHPEWRTRRVRSCRVAVDFGRTYGERWAFLTERKPDSVVVAEGSAVAVYPAARGQEYAR
jgi:uncharacterized protein YqjF (DUF2071 family)